MGDMPGSRALGSVPAGPLGREDPSLPCSCPLGHTGPAPAAAVLAGRQQCSRSSMSPVLTA